MNKVSVLYLALLGALLCLPAWGQRAAELTGTVADPSGASITGAQVTALNTQTGVKLATVTTSAGQYRFVEVVSGNYRVEASAPGFKTTITEVVLETSRVTTVNLNLSMGDVSSVVKVEATAPTLETQSPTVSDIIEPKLIETLPVAIRRPLQLLTAGAAVTYFQTEPTTTQTPFFSVAGGKTMPALYIDGGNGSNSRVEWNVLAVNPTIEATSEFRLVDNSYKAEYGGSGSGLMLVTTKSGTNQFHGSAWEFHREKLFDARNYFAATKQPFHENLYGGAFGGPILKNKLFFFATIERTKNITPSTVFQTVPTALQRQGDFSQTFNADGSLQTIYDPYSTQANPAYDPSQPVSSSNSPIIRDAFPGNIIPSDRLSPIALAMLSHVPNPNNTPLNITGLNNFVGVATNGTDRTAYTARVDYDMSASNKLFYRFIYDNGPFQYDGPWPGDPLAKNIIKATGDLSTRNPWDPGDQVFLPYSRNQIVGWTHIIKPTLINDIRWDYATRSWGAHSSSLSLGLPSQLGIVLPPTPESKSGKFGTPLDAVPTFSASGFNLVGNSWGAGDYQLPMRDWNLIDAVTWEKGSHTFKFGYETRRSAGTSQGYSSWPGSFGFSPNGTGSNPFDSTTGSSLASLILDWPINWNAQAFATVHVWSWWHSGYVQDDWRISRNLTLSLGVRYEVDTPVQEGMGSNCDLEAPYNWNKCKNRMTGFNPYAINPVSLTPGVITFPTKSWKIDNNNFAPRFGFAYSFNGGSTVIRGGGGMFYYYPTEGWGTRNYAGTRPDLAIAIASSTPDNGITAPFHLDDLPTFPPFDPSQINPGLYTAPLGQPARVGITALDPNYHTPYGVQYNINIEHQMKNQLFFELGFISNNGHHLFGGNPQNQVPVSQAGPSITQADRPFPQFQGITLEQENHHSNYKGLVFKVQRRFANGLAFTSSYTYSRLYDDVGGPGGGPGFAYQDAYNLKGEWGLSGDNRTHRFVWSGNYDLPVGRGQRYLTHGIGAYVLGNWSIASQWSLFTGEPLTPYTAGTTCNCFNSGTRANLVPNVSPDGPRKVNNWFNTDAFVNPGNFAIGDTPRGIIIGPGTFNVDASISKDVPMTERIHLTIRGDFYNFFNHTNFNNPVTSIPQRNSAGDFIGSTNFISSAKDPRRVQLSARISF